MYLKAAFAPVDTNPDRRNQVMQTAALATANTRTYQGARAGIISPLPLALLGVFVLALTIRIGATAAFVKLDAPPRESANPDQLDYELLAYRMSTGQGFTLQDRVPTACPGHIPDASPRLPDGGQVLHGGALWFCLLSALTCTSPPPSSPTNFSAR